VFPLQLTRELGGGDTAPSTVRWGAWPVGARIGHFLTNWHHITRDPWPWVLSVVAKGFQLPFKAKKPDVSLTPLITRFPPEHKGALIQAVEDLLTKQAVIQVHNYQQSPGYYSPYFLASKKDGSLRPILNLKRFNKYLEKEKFRMETLRSILQTLQLGDWLYSLDLNDDYLVVPIYVNYQKYLRFAYLDNQGKTLVFQWPVLPFGQGCSQSY
jgi:hypothetical protein